jgi:hypothetical protein
MTNEREPTREGSADEEQVADLPAQTPEEVTLEYLPEPPGGPEGRRIHKRRRPPAVPEGPEESDPHPSPPADLERPQC